ncbi:MAG: N-acetylmuramoyl-L-alanine amidase [Candidatus Omnitrophica bacterium]|nr:N-acetylmuramoyl-L-alanine amidase [Candidatus Omnitrophota bacterium]
MQTYKYKYYTVISILAFLAMALAGCASQRAYFKADPSVLAGARTIDGAQYIPLEKLCGSYDVRYKWDSYIGTAKIEKGVNEIVLRAGSGTILVNGAHKKMDRSAVLSSGQIYVPMSFVNKDFGSIVGVKTREVTALPEVIERPRIYRIRTVVIDAGHGGKDPGATGRRLRLREKQMTLAIAKKLGSILEGSGLRVIYTRKDDTFIPLPTRADIANRAKADLFVSVHINASRSKLLNGFECYHLSEATDDNARALEAFEDSSLSMNERATVEHSRQLDKTLWDLALTENREESSELASYVCDAIEGARTSCVRGVRSARFYVLKHTHMPAVLVEVGYLSNRTEEVKLQDPTFLDRIAESVAAGVLKYKNEYERTEGFSHR